MFAMLLAVACAGWEGAPAEGTYANEERGIELTVGQWYFVERVGGREVRGQWRVWAGNCDHVIRFLSGPCSKTPFTGVLLDPNQAQTNREQLARWSRDQTELTIEVEPGRRVTFVKRP